MAAFILTERLTLRGLVPEDLDPLHDILGHEETMRFYPHPFSRDETARWIERNIQRYADDGFGLWAVVLRETGEFAGDCGLTLQDVDGTTELEVGYHIKRALWRRGLATEAARACMSHAFDVVGATKLIALVRVENEPSAGVARKLGMTVEKETIRAGMRHLVFAVHRPA